MYDGMINAKKFLPFVCVILDLISASHQYKIESDILKKYPGEMTTEASRLKTAMNDESLKRIFINTERSWKCKLYGKWWKTQTRHKCVDGI